MATVRVKAHRRNGKLVRAHTRRVKTQDSNKIYKVFRGRGKPSIYLPEADALEYASHGHKIVRVKKLPKGYEI